MIKALAGIAPRHPTIEKHKAPAGKVNGKNGKVIYKSGNASADTELEHHRLYSNILRLQNKNADSPVKGILANTHAGTAGDTGAKNAQKRSEGGPTRSLGPQAKKQTLKFFEDFAPDPDMRETLLASIPNVQDARTPSKTLPSSSDN